VLDERLSERPRPLTPSPSAIYAQRRIRGRKSSGH
jgi:hypothetical protein